MKRIIRIVLITAVICVIAYPFIRPVTLYRDLAVIRNGQMYFSAKNISFRITLPAIFHGALGELVIKDAKILNKFTSREMKGQVSVYWKGIMLDGLSVDLLGGVIEGTAIVDFAKILRYTANLNIKNIQLQKIIETLKMSEKISLTGSASGHAVFKSRASELTNLSGHISASPEGGVLAINNKVWLERIAAYTKQDVNIVVENFTNYHYNEGNLRLGLKGSDIVLTVYLNGETGRRDLVITAHDFNL